MTTTDEQADEDFLGTVDFFADLPADVRAQLSSALEWVRVAAGDWLFRQGDPGDTILVVRTGRLEVVVDVPGGQRRAGTLGPGSVLGELALLLGGVRTASVRALRETELMVLRQEVFDRLLREVPEFAVSVTRTLARELVRRVPPVSPVARECAVLAVVGLTDPGPVAGLVSGLVEELSRWGPVVPVERPDGPLDEAEAGRRLGALEAAHTTVVLAAPRWDDDTGWARFCARQADTVLVVVDPRTPPPARTDPVLAGCDVLVWSPPTEDGSRTGRWLDTLQARAHHLVNPGEGEPEDVARLARRLTGHSLGVVLSGGGARGFAHIGVLSALTAGGWTVDRVGGTSMGSLIAALFALRLDPVEIAHRCRVELVDRRPFNDYTVPRYGLIRARKAAGMLERLFGEVDLETTSRSLFTVSADLVSGQEVVHRRGRVARAVGASMCLPGLVAPVVDGTRLLVDGGVLNNLPVDVMSASGEGPVIAVDVVRKEDAASACDGAVVPALVETLGRTCVLGSRRKTDATRGLAALLISPAIAGVGLLDFRALPRVVAEGRRVAEEALASGAAALLLPRPAD